MSILPNILSLSRFPLALLLFIQNPYIRCSAIVCALISDVLDGFLARKLKCTSKIGTLLDPLTDKFFVIIALAIFFAENSITAWELGSFLCRDVSLILFSLFLFCVHGWDRYTISAFYCGKIVTALQFLTLFALSAGYEVPGAIFMLMGFVGCLSFVELLLRYRSHSIA